MDEQWGLGLQAAERRFGLADGDGFSLSSDA